MAPDSPATGATGTDAPPRDGCATAGQTTGATGATVVGRRAAEARSLQVCGTLFYADFKGIQCHRHERVVANDTHELR